MRLNQITENATSGATGAGSVATFAQPTGSLKKRSMYQEGDDSQPSPTVAGTSGMDFIRSFRKSPHFVAFHEIQPTFSGYYARIELDVGNIYEMELNVSK